MGTTGRDEAVAQGRTWAVEIDAWMGWLKASGCSRGTLRLRRHYLLTFARSSRRRGPWTVTTDELVEWLSTSAWSTETRRSARASVRGFYSWAHLTQRTRSNPAAVLPSIAPPRAIARPTPEQILRDALGRVDERTRVMLQLGAIAGLRRGEIATLHADHVLEGVDGWALHVTGKGGHHRRIPVPDHFARRLLRRAADGGGWVFPGPHGHLSPDHVGRLLSQALPGRWTAHTLRHRYATVTHRAGRDLYVVKELLGHAKLDTTLRYIEQPDDALRAAASAAWDAA